MSDTITTTSFELAVYVKGDTHAKKLALVLPGKLDTKDYAHMRSHVDFLAQKGFFALSFDPPGTWDSKGPITLYTMSTYLQAVNELIEYYGNMPTFVMGHSRGSTIALLAMLRNPHVIAAGAILCSYQKEGFPTKPDKVWQEKGYHLEMRDLPPGGGEEIVRFELPYSFYEDQSQYNFTKELEATNKPKLFILGTRDTIAKPTIVRDTFAIAGEPKQLVEIDSDHNYRLHKELIAAVNTIVECFLLDFSLIPHHS